MFINFLLFIRENAHIKPASTHTIKTTCIIYPQDAHVPHHSPEKLSQVIHKLISLQHTFHHTNTLVKIPLKFQYNHCSPFGRVTWPFIWANLVLKTREYTYRVWLSIYIFYYFHLEKCVALYLKKNLIHLSVVLEKKILKTVHLFSLFVAIFPLEKGCSILLNKNESILPWLLWVSYSLAQWFSRRKVYK